MRPRLQVFDGAARAADPVLHKEMKLYSTRLQIQEDVTREAALITRAEECRMRLEPIAQRLRARSMHRSVLTDSGVGWFL